MFLERPDQGLGLQISLLARNLLCNTFTHFCYGFAYDNYVCNNVRCIVPDK